MKTINLIAAMFLSVALSGPAADAGRIPLNGTMEASESYQSLPDPSLGFFGNASGTATTERLGQLLLFYDGIVDVAISAGPGGTRLIDTNGDSIYALYWGQGAAPDPNGDVRVVHTATIVGGTGRYADATGSFTVDRMLNIFTGATSGSINGTIIVRDHR